MFHHESLADPHRDIRLLQIKPGDNDEDIECTLNPSDLTSVAEYAAISYTWGDPAVSRQIWIIDESLLVRRNCHYALWQIRRSEVTHDIWIDSLRINQSDSREKTV